MNILYLAHRIPFPPNKGDKIRSYHQIQHLSNSHNVYLACLVDDEEDFQYVSELKKLCRIVETARRSTVKQFWPTGKAFLKGQALSVGAFYSRELQQKIHAILKSIQIDCILAFSSPMAEYVRNVNDVPKFMDFVDLDSEKWRAYAEYQPFPFSWLYRLEATRLSQYEKTVAEEFDHSMFVSSVEAQLFCRVMAKRSVSVVPNGVDLEFFDRNGSVKIGNDKPSIVFTAAMDYFPNIDGARFFCEDILPRIAQSVPNVSFTIVGRKPDSKVLKLARSGLVHVTGTVPDVRSYLTDAAVAVIPLRIARGVQNKILEAMAMGLPVVGTTNAFQGIAVSPEDGIRIVDDPVDFANEVTTFLQDPLLRKECGLKARRFVEKHCRWEDCGLILENLISGKK